LHKEYKYGIYLLILIIVLEIYDTYHSYQTTSDIWNSEWFRWRIALFILVIAGGIIYILFRKIQKARYKQQEFTQKIIHAQEHEWKLIAAELHDSVGQNLTFVNNKILQLANSLSVESNKNELMNISKNVVVSLDEIRRIINKLYPHVLERLGFKKALDSLISRAISSSNLTIDYSIEDISSLLPFESQINLYRIVQEALNNILTHSKANNASVELYSDDRRVYLNIEDDGTGFDINKINFSKPLSGFGIESIKERVRIIGGKIRLDSRALQGTKISIVIPVK
jgi:signal transduction histidine kinase